MSMTDPCWTWLLRKEGDGERSATDKMLSALSEAAQRLGIPATVWPFLSVMFQTHNLTIHATDGGHNNCVDAQGDGGGEISWSLGHRPFLLMYYASLKVNPLFQTNQFGEPKLLIADENVRLIPEFSVWSDFEAYLKPFVENGLGMKQCKEDLIALGLIQAPIVMCIDDDDEDHFYPLIG